MMNFDRFDICEAHFMFAMLFHGGMGCPIYRRFAQLERVGYCPSPLISDPRDLSKNAREIYRDLVVNHCGIHSTAPDR